MATPFDMVRNGAKSEMLVVDVEWRDGASVVQLRRELDLATVDVLRATLDGLGACRSLVIDMRGLSFIDSSGLHLLVELQQRAERDGLELRLVAPPAPVDTPIRLCGLDERLPFVAELPAGGLAA
jgi:anti-sigma B factor antagonist